MRFNLLFLLLALNLAGFSQNTTRPWTYWWWMGSAVDSANIEYQLQSFEQAGMGGVHIIPIYGVKGYEDQFLDFLSDDWMRMVSFTIEKARSYRLGVDITLGTGWPYGGPMVTKQQSAKKLEIGKLSEKTKVPPFKPTGQTVKRAAPGGEGWVLDYFDREYVASYLNHFDSVFRNSPYPIEPRAFYHDSYEVYGADWTPRFLEQFEQVKGYDITGQLHLLYDPGHPDRPKVVHELREVLAELLYTQFTETWSRWSHDQGRQTRNQAHGSPGNILDLYALSDIPETESFGCSDFNIPGLACDVDYEPEKFGRPSPLMMKFASSPAHLLGKSLVSSETATWLANHFKVSLQRIKPQIDELFTAGINHIFYHGITYSPQEEPWPGWLFYASTNFGQSSHFWDELPLLNRYIETCQTVLQHTEPDNDILLYFPIHDLWTSYPGNILLMLDVHKYQRWFSNTPFGETAQQLWDRGYCFDYISDKQIQTADLSKYKTIVIPPAEIIPSKTRKKLSQLAQAGMPILFLDRPDLGDKLAHLRIQSEAIKQEGLDFIRKKNEHGKVYFITNLADQFCDDTIDLSADYKAVEICKPMTGQQGFISTSSAFRLQLKPGESCLIQTYEQHTSGREWKSFDANDTICLNSPWRVSFNHRYKEVVYSDYTISKLSSWTEWKDISLADFCGKATYQSTFSIPVDRIDQRFTIYFESIRESAQVIINGTDCGTIWALPYELEIPTGVIREENTIEIIVQNLSANYLRTVDTERPEWKKFYDINFADITYKPFKAKNWNLMPSGIIGEVLLINN